MTTSYMMYGYETYLIPYMVLIRATLLEFCNIFSRYKVTRSVLSNGARNACDISWAITRNEVSHEPWIIPQAHKITKAAFYLRVFWGVVYISTGKAAAKLCRQINELVLMEYSSV